MSNCQYLQKHNKQDRQALLKAKYCPRATPVQHLVNAGQLVQAVICTQKNTTTARDVGFYEGDSVQGDYVLRNFVRFPSVQSI